MGTICTIEEEVHGSCDEATAGIKAALLMGSGDFDPQKARHIIEQVDGLKASIPQMYEDMAQGFADDMMSIYEKRTAEGKGEPEKMFRMVRAATCKAIGDKFGFDVTDPNGEGCPDQAKGAAE